MLPRLGFCTPPSRPSKVVLPLPLGPLRKRLSPRCRVKLSISSNSGWPGQAKPRLDSWIRAELMDNSFRGALPLLGGCSCAFCRSQLAVVRQSDDAFDSLIASKLAPTSAARLETQGRLCRRQLQALLAVRADQLYLNFLGGGEALEQLGQVQLLQFAGLFAVEMVMRMDFAVLAVFIVMFFVLVLVVFEQRAFQLSFAQGAIARTQTEQGLRVL